MKLFVLICLLLPFLSFATEQDSGLPTNATQVQAQEYIDTSENCMIVQNKKQIVLKCGDNMIFVTPNGVGVKTPSNSQFWSK
jgi:antirestriction protein ArdC